MNSQEWREDLLERCERHLNNLEVLSPTLSHHISASDDLRMVRKFKVSDLEAKKICQNNLREYDRLKKILFGRCAECKCPISLDEKNLNHLIGIGNVCSVCYGMYTALQSMGLRDRNYFKKLHDEWKQGPDDKWRDRAGM